jgi:hypothetical protein
MKHNDIVKALHSLRPGAEWTLSGENYENLNWLSTDIAPSYAEIEAEIAILPAKEAAEQNAKEFQKAELLKRLGITLEEATLLVG